jgi:hypothetical protein
LLNHFGGDDPHARGVGQHTDKPDVGLFEEELHGIAVHHLDAIHGVQQIAIRTAFFRQEALIGEFHILGHELAAVDRGFIVPFDALAQVEDIGGVIELFPTFSQVGLDDEGARRNVRPDFMPYQFAVDEADGAIRSASGREMVIKVRGIRPAHAQDATPLGLFWFAAPEQSWPSQRPQGKRGARDKASGQQLTAGQMRGNASDGIRYPQGDPSL